MPNLPLPLRLAVVPLIAGLLAISGCGSSHSSSSSPSSTGLAAPSTRSAAPASAGPLCPNGETACVSQNTSITASGPKTLSTNLLQLMLRSNPKLKQVQLGCPQASSYPVICQLTATDMARGKTTRIKGQLTVMGIDTATHTYAYSILYAPVPGQ